MVPKQLFTNNAVSLLASPISAGSNVLTVLAGHGEMFPTPQANEYFLVTLEDQSASVREIVYVTSRNGDSFTILRGQEDTTARAWTASANADTLVDHRVTAASLMRLENDYFNPGFTALTNYKEALDFLLAKPDEVADLTAVNNRIDALQAEIDPVFDQIEAVESQLTPIQTSLDDLQEQVIQNNLYANPDFPSITNYQEAVDYLLEGNPTAGGQAIDVEFVLTPTSTQTLLDFGIAYKPGSTSVYVGGIRQKRGVDFIESTPTQLRLQYLITQEMIDVGQNIVVDFIVA